MITNNPNFLQKNSSRIPLIPSNLMICSIQSKSSISNYIAQTPKENNFKFNFKKATRKPMIKDNNQENKFQSQNIRIKNNNKQNDSKQINKLNTLPYKMIKSQLPATCINHYDKQSAYFIESEDKQIIFYCEKCAILIASQGFHVDKIQNNISQKKIYNQNIETNSIRLSINDTKTVTKKSKFINEIIKKQVKQKQLTTFLNRIERTQSHVYKIFEFTEKQLQNIDIAVDKSLNQIKLFFEKLHKTLDLFQDTYLYNINQKNLQIRQQLQIKCQQMSKDLQNLQNMKIDICQTYDDIINITKNDQFQTVMNAYNQNIKQIEQFLQQNQNKKMDFINTNRIKRDFNIQIQEVQIINKIQKQFDKLKQPIKKLSTKSATRRMSLMNMPNNRGIKLR